MNDTWQSELEQALPLPPREVSALSRRRVEEWFARTAPVIWWDAIDTPIGVLRLAASRVGLCRVELGLDEATFIARLDPLARVQRDPGAMAAFTGQLREYFSRARRAFDLAVDLTALSPFQRRVLEAVRAIPAGSVWTYSQVARTIGAPRASRAVGHALSTNPMLIVLPCHRVIASDGSLRGYKAGLPAKEALLRLENAL